MANELKRKRREELGDKAPGERIMSNDPTSGVPPQPQPNLPQGQGNMMNNPQVGLSMGGGMSQPGSLSGTNLFPYGDGGIPVEAGVMGSVGFVQNSGLPENLVPGRMLNSQPYGTVDQVGEGMGQEMLGPMHLAHEAATRAEKAYAYTKGDKAPPYQIGPLGMMGRPVEVAMQGQVTPGQFPMQMPQQSGMTMPLTGNTTQSVAFGNPNNMGSGNTGGLGMSTGRGGGRNKQA